MDKLVVESDCQLRKREVGYLREEDLRGIGMNAMVCNKMDWSKRSAHQWLEQYGLWVRSVKIGTVSANPLANLIDKNDVTRVRASKTSMPCEINDIEGVQVSQLLAKMHGDSRVFV